MGYAHFQLRRGTKAAWLADNTLLAEGELVLELDTGQYKLGDGVTRYSDLPYGGTVGPKGGDGAAATITVGTVTTGAPGSAAAVQNVGTASAAELNFTIPAGVKGESGDDGAAATITVGTVATGAPGTAAAVDNVGTPSAAVLDFIIPAGDKGDPGDVAEAPANGAAHVRRNAGWDPLGADSGILIDGANISTRGSNAITISASTTLTAAHFNRWLWFDSATPINITVPLGLVLPEGAQIEGQVVGAGNVTFVFASGVTPIKHAKDSLVSDGTGSVIGLRYKALNVFALFGRLGAA